MLNELQLDALTELVNLGVSSAALGLRDMVREEVHLSVPRVALLSGQEAMATLAEGGPRRAVSVHQDFAGDITGRAMLLFPEASSMELVRALTGGDLSTEDIMELEPEALAETGNVLLNACLSTIANSLERTLRISLPEVIHSDGEELPFLGLARSAESVLFIHINFSVRRRSMNGYIAMLMDLPSLVALGGLLDEFIVRSTGSYPSDAG